MIDGPVPTGGAGDRADGGDGGAIPDHVVDAFFDRELDESARRAFLRSLPKDLSRCEEVASTRRMLDLFKSGAGAGGGAEAVPGPDLTGRIIAAVDARRGFASRRVRQVARVVRLGLAAGLVLVVGAVAAVERVNPDATRLAPAPAPLTSAVRETQTEMVSALGSLASTFETIHLRVGGHLRVEGHGLAQGHGPAAGTATDLTTDLNEPVWDAASGPIAYTLAVSGADDHVPGFHTISVVSRVASDGRSKAHGGMGAGAPDEVARGVAEAVELRRSVALGLAYSFKADPRTMVWRAEMAPGSRAWRSGGGAGGARPVARLIDADGCCSGMVVPLGIDRGEAMGGAFVLPRSESWVPMGGDRPAGMMTPLRIP